MWLSAVNVEIQIGGKMKNLLHKISDLDVFHVGAKNE